MCKFSASLVRIGPVGGDGDTPELARTPRHFLKAPFLFHGAPKTIISSKNSKSIFERSQGYI